MWLVSLAIAQAASPEAQTSAAQGAPPSVRIAWRKGEAQLSVAAPPGMKLGADAPASVEVLWGDRASALSGDGAQLMRGLSLGDVRGQSVSGSLDVSLCDLAGTTCRPTSWSLSGLASTAKKGTIDLLLATPESTHERPFGPDASASGAEEAFARAKASGKLVLLDFSAVWCPPCNMLADEVLHRDLPELDGFEIAILDADHPSSFSLKSRYKIGGYPTVVVATADGTERTRIVGYDGLQSFLSWLASAPTSSDGSDLGKPAEEVAPERAAVLAWMRVEQHDYKSAEAWLARAETASESFRASSIELHLARFALTQDPADLSWLLAHAPDRAGDFAGPAAEMLEKHGEGQPLADAERAILLAVRDAEGVALADALYSAASLASHRKDEPTSRMYHAASVSLVRSAMSGDPDHDKGYISWLASELEASGDTDAAIALLVDSVARWPDEPTFDLDLAPLLSRLGRHEEALVSADRAISLAWADNRLRAVAAKADILVALGRSDEAKAVAEAELAAQPAPESEIAVRTHRYRQRLQAFLASPEPPKQ